MPAIFADHPVYGPVEPKPEAERIQVPEFSIAKIEDQTANDRDGWLSGTFALGQTPPAAAPASYESDVLALPASQFFTDTYELTPQAHPYSWVSTNYMPFTNGTVRSYGGWAYLRSGGNPAALFASRNGAISFFNVDISNMDVGWSPAVFSAVNTWTAAWPGLDEWVFWGLVYDEPADLVRLYINGELVSEQACTVQYGGAQTLGITWGGWNGGNLNMSGYQYGNFVVEENVTAAEWEQLGPVTAVSATRAINYDISGTVTASRGLSYDIENVISASRAITYDLENAVSATRGLSYDIENALAAGRAITYDIENTVSASRAVVYDIVSSSTVTATRALTYDIENSVTFLRTLPYDIENSVTASRAVSYDIENQLVSARALVYDLGEPVAPAGAAYHLDRRKKIWQPDIETLP